MSGLEQYYRQTRACLGCCICQPACPLFQELRRETAGPRAKVHLVRELLEGGLEYSPRLRELLDLCLDCRQCAEACPARLPIHELVLAARAEFVRRRGLVQGLGWFLRHVLGPHGRLLARGMGLAAWGRHAHLGRYLGPAAQDLLSLLPNPMASPLHRRLAGYHSPPGSRGRVGFFLGCLSDHLYPATSWHAIRALEQAGYQVVVPLEVACCGTPQLFYGDMEAAYRQAVHNFRAFAPSGDLVAVVSDCASCVSGLRRYGEAFAERPLGDDLGSLASRVYEVCEFLIREGTLEGAKSRFAAPRAAFPPLTVTCHDPCHLVRGGGDPQAARRMLQALPGVNLVEMLEADRCCGAGGSFNLTHPELSTGVREKKIAHIAASGAQLVATTCPACRSQITAGLAARNLPLRVLHPVDLLFGPEERLEP